MVDTIPPAKTLSMGLDIDNKENNVAGEPLSVENVEIGLKKSQALADEDVKPVAVAVAPTVKELEAEEPLLQENPHRFVLFPIKYHEVRVFGFSTYIRVGLCLLVPLGDELVADWL